MCCGPKLARPAGNPSHQIIPMSRQGRPGRGVRRCALQQQFQAGIQAHAAGAGRLCRLRRAHCFTKYHALFSQDRRATG